MLQPRNIALFGGTFDPVHLGHLQMAELARSELALDEVRFLPCHISPHKTQSQPTSAFHRIEMLRLATADFPWAVIDDFETQREGPSFSYQTAEAMAATFPEARLFWIMGSDQWDALDTWTNPQRLAACVEFIVFTRGDSPTSHTAREGFNLHVLHLQHPASSTAIRRAISYNKSIEHWLHPCVANYIKQHQLYRHD